MANSNRQNTKLTDAQLVLLSAASQRDDGLLIPPESIKGPALAADLKALLKRGLVEAVGAERKQTGGPADDRGEPVTARITRAGLDALGIVPGSDDQPTPNGAARGRVSRKQGRAQPTPAAGSGEQPAPSEKAIEPVPVAPASAQAAARSGTKQARVIALLSREDGATLDDLIAETGWLPHTTRAALTGLRQKGYVLTKSKDADGRTVYHIGDADQDAPAHAGGSDR
jgi:hypothetical protein